MQPILRNKKSLVAAALLMGMSNASMAATGTYTVTAGTIQDVIVEQVTGNTFTFGTGIYTTTGGTCTMDASAPAEALVKIDIDNLDDGPAAASGVNFTDETTFRAGTLASSATGGCIDKDEESYGLFVITGEPDSFVTLTVGSASATEFDFTPGNGCVPFFDGTGSAATSGDVCAAVNADVPITNLRIPGADEFSSAEATITEESGALYFTVGGTIEITNGGVDLTGGQAYSVDFPITVLYE
ncbi:MAG: hypothetical protein ACJAZB_000483 [Psychrosphaera sp.]|jgi:hypothetical protein